MRLKKNHKDPVVYVRNLCAQDKALECAGQACALGAHSYAAGGLRAKRSFPRRRREHGSRTPRGRRTDPGHKPMVLISTIVPSPLALSFFLLIQ